jgi:hypothetical protein
MKLVLCGDQLCTVIIRRLSPPKTQKILRWEVHVAYMWDRKWDWEAWTGLSGSGQGQVASTGGCSNEPSGSRKCGGFLN